jgi:cobalt-zinc-cadmium efflux system membrane fusion protein
MRAFCEVQYNLNELARVTPLARGVVRRVLHDVGDHVEAGDVLAELHSVSAASAKSDYLAALVEQEIQQRAFDRESKLKQQEIAAEKDFFDADAAYRTAQLRVKTLRQRIINFGFTQDEINEIERTLDTSANLAIRAPFAGEVIERSAVTGEAVEIGDPLFTVADLSSRWIVMSIPSSQISRIRRGQRMEARFDALPNLTFTGQITRVDAAIDPRTRMVGARGVTTEHTEQLKTGLFGVATIHVAHDPSGVHIPRDAIQHHEGNDFVFVRDEPDLFALRRVQLGAAIDDSVHILAGLALQEAVVTEGSFIVMSEFLKSRLGAGCVHE